MLKNKILVVGNWKMNPSSIGKAKEIFKSLKSFARNLKKIKLVICPPFVYLSDLEKLADSQVVLGAQDVFWEKEGSFTGEISPRMLVNESYVILGHSERRALGESDEIVARKIISAIRAGLHPILCVGEKERDLQGNYLLSLRTQIINSLGKLPKKLINRLVIAYEPVWAIGQTEALGAVDVHESSLFVRKVLAEIYDSKTAMTIPILYGGSVNHDNAKEMITFGEVQGLLVGRESLKPKNFGNLLKEVDAK